MFVFGGEGNDVMTTDRGNDGTLTYGALYGGQGNDRITAPKSTGVMIVYGGDGDDKISGVDGGFIDVYNGGNGNDIIYGGSDKTGPPRYWGDFSNIVNADPSLAAIGGNDKIYGGDNIT